jgi:hypothetical protein
VMLGVLGACSSSPSTTPTGAVCPDPDPMTLTWDSFGEQFMTTYCTACHSTELSHSMRNGAPLYHDYDTLAGVLKIPDHVDENAGAGPEAVNTRMPPSRCPSVPGGKLDRDCPEPTEAERTELAVWVACEQQRAGK